MSPLCSVTVSLSLIKYSFGCRKSFNQSFNEDTRQDDRNFFVSWFAWGVMVDIHTAEAEALGPFLATLATSERRRRGRCSTAADVILGV